MKRKEQRTAPGRHGSPDTLELEGGSRVAVIGSGPAGSLFTYFLLEMAGRIGLDLAVDLYEPRDFCGVGPGGCNMCGGIISETLVQNLAAEGVNLPDSVVQRGIDSYVLHTDVGSVRIETPLNEKRIAAVHRGGGPRDLTVRRWESFDRHLQKLAMDRGAELVPCRVDAVTFDDGRPQVRSSDGSCRPYDLLAVAVGVNSPALKMLQGLGVGYEAPETTKTFISEYFLGEEVISRAVGSSMHVFLLNIPRLEFAAIIPKGDYVSICLLGEAIDKELVQAFLSSREVTDCMPAGWRPQTRSCFCSPRINVRGSRQPFADRIVFIGDCGVTRLYKDGIGAAYRTAKAAAATAVFKGVGAESFRTHYLPACKAIQRDNGLGKVIFAATGKIQRHRFARRALLRMTEREQRRSGGSRLMSQVLWDMFTGSAPYRDIVLRTLRPAFLGGLLWSMIGSIAAAARGGRWGREETAMAKSGLGATYHDGEIIVREGDLADRMFVIQKGRAQILVGKDGQETPLRVAGEGELIGEMAIFERDVRSATVRALGEVRVLTVDKKNFLRRIHEDPSLAFRVVQTMSRRVRELSDELACLKGEGSRVQGSGGR